MSLKSFFYTSLTALCMTTTMSWASAQGTGSTADAARPAREFATYSVHQQQGATCPYSPFVNLAIVRELRSLGGGEIALRAAPAYTKRQSYALVAPRMMAFDRAMDFLLQSEGPYANLDRAIRTQGVKKEGRFNEKGKFVNKIDWLPINKERRDSYTPFNTEMKDIECFFRWLPLIQQEDGRMSFYDAATDTETSLTVGTTSGESAKFFSGNFYDFSEAQIHQMGFLSVEEFTQTEIQYGQALGGAHQFGFYKASSPSVSFRTPQMEVFYDVGTYYQMLFAMGVDRENNLIQEGHDLFPAHQEFRAAMDADVRNPWANMNRNDFFGYHVAEIIKTNPVIKRRVIEVLSTHLNKPWTFYQETLNYYDSADQATRVLLRDKQEFLPGEDQMLAYFFSQEVLQVWAATISDEAVLAITAVELNKVELFFVKSFMGSKSMIKDVCDPKCGPRGAKYSFMDVWEDVRTTVLHKADTELGGVRDFVTFSSHGAVISFDMSLIASQTHQDYDVARRLGFEQWDSYFDNGLNPFYRRAPAEMEGEGAL